MRVHEFYVKVLRLSIVNEKDCEDSKMTLEKFLKVLSVASY